MVRIIGLIIWLSSCLVASAVAQGQGSTPPIPEPLKPWKEWILWEAPYVACPSPYNAADQHICIWPSSLELTADARGSHWKAEVRAFAKSWLPLPGDKVSWPQNVELDKQLVPVVERAGVPSLLVSAGSHIISGDFQWPQMPERIAVPPSFALLDLHLNDQPVTIPNRDAGGSLWLRRRPAADVPRDSLVFKVHRLIEDGLPIWLRTELDLSVSGKSREEDIGFVLPEGWQLSFVSSPIPVAVDEHGRVKAQVRPGHWLISIDAFRNEDLSRLEYAGDTPSAVASELIAVRARPELRIPELQGGATVDASLTTFPERWRNLPVVEWKNKHPLVWAIKSIGAGEQQPNRFTIERELWVDDDGRGITYQDKIWGQPKQIARLDATVGHELAGVQIDGVRQLITQNPATGAHGVELRSGFPKIEAIGRMKRTHALLATGWQADADSLELDLWLPPGWRALAVFGPDSVDGDWLTAWTLLDLFLLLVFALAAYRLWGLVAGLTAFFAFGLSYHEFGSPRYTWLLLLMPVALLYVVRQGKLTRWLEAWRYLALGMLLLFLIPFVARQIQDVLYPQLESTGILYQPRTLYHPIEQSYLPEAVTSGRNDDQSLDEKLLGGPFNGGSPPSRPSPADNNMRFDPGSSIQTGIARPSWYGTRVHCSWDGPVASGQTIQPVLLSSWQHRSLIVLRLGLVAMLLRFFLRKSSPTAMGWFSLPRRAAVAASLVIASLVGTGGASAQSWPDAETLQALRDRLLKPDDAFPNAAEIARMRLAIDAGRLTFNGEIHAAVDCAVPMPGQFPTWSPLTIRLNDAAGIACRREDGYLWIWVPKGVHRFTLEGLINDVPEWSLSLALVPRQLELDAPEWDVSGLHTDGPPDKQLIFIRKERPRSVAPGYDEKSFHGVAQIDRALEIGLVWKVHNTLRRLSAPGKALSLKVPLLAGERVITANVESRDGLLEINLPAYGTELKWDSELQVQPEIRLQSKWNSSTVERWSLLTSPVWNVNTVGLKPIYEGDHRMLIPVWYPWPGEHAELEIKRPAAIDGKTLTINRVEQRLALGNRQRNSTLRLEVESSQGEEFAVELPESAKVSGIAVNQTSLPVRRHGDQYLLSLQAGAQTVDLEWSTDEPMGTVAAFPAIRLPVESGNIRSHMQMPESRWILWTDGPIRGPAVRFWVILLIACGTAWALSRHSLSPLRAYEWILLAIGLTQIDLLASLVIILWLFLLARRAKISPQLLSPGSFNGLQVALVVLTILSLGILVSIVSKGLLGSPEMFILGNNSYGNQLEWFAPVAGAQLATPWVVSISIWYYRLLMLFWALWLSNAVLRWLKMGWTSFSSGGVWKSSPARPSISNAGIPTAAIVPPADVNR